MKTYWPVLPANLRDVASHLLGSEEPELRDHVEAAVD
jgi:hypothetical protein